MRARELATTIAVSALALTGCSGSGEDEGSDTSSTSRPDTSSSSSSTSGGGSPTSGRQSTTSSSPATEEGPPPEAQANTKEGAEAFAKWYWEENGDAYVTGDTSLLKEASSSQCEVCLSVIRLHDTNSKKYGLAKRNPYTVNVVASAQDEAGVWRVKLSVNQPKFRLFKEGAATATVRATKYEVNPQLQRQSDHWLLRDWLMIQ